MTVSIGSGRDCKQGRGRMHRQVMRYMAEQVGNLSRIACSSLLYINYGGYEESEHLKDSKVKSRKSCSESATGSGIRTNGHTK